MGERVDLDELERLLAARNADAALSVKDRHYGVANANWKAAIEQAGAGLIAEVRELREKVERAHEVIDETAALAASTARSAAIEEAAKVCEADMSYCRSQGFNVAVGALADAAERIRSLASHDTGGGG